MPSTNLLTLYKELSLIIHSTKKKKLIPVPAMLEDSGVTQPGLNLLLAGDHTLLALSIFCDVWRSVNQPEGVNVSLAARSYYACTVNNFL